MRTVCRFAFGLAASLVWLPSAALSATALEEEFQREIHPLLNRFCLDCHSSENPKGDLDLERFSSVQKILADATVWERVVEQVSLGEMPPKEKKQPSSDQRQQLLHWVGRALDAAAEARAGDPGPVVLRRLNNAEYTYTIRDLTGVDSLEPAREFPADSAAGEGFMNTGNALVMSPALVTKFLDAAKEIASHAVLLPDGFRFSSKRTRPDWTEEVLQEIRRFYARYTASTGGDKVNLQGIIFETNEGGRLPVESYLRALIAERERLSVGAQFDQVAQGHGLSPKYLKGLWTLLNDSKSSILLDDIRKEWRSPEPNQRAMVEWIQQRQKALWKFSSVGHIGKAGGPKAWMEPVSPLATNQQLRVKIPPATTGDVTIYLVATDAGDGRTSDFVRWKRPRITSPGRPDLPLRHAREFIAQAMERRTRLFNSTARALSAVAEMRSHGDIPELAARHQLDPADLTAWTRFLGLSEAPLALDYLTNQLHSASGYDFVKGWGSDDTPLILANSSDQSVRIPGNMKAHGVTVHPSPTRSVAAGWRAPAADSVRLVARVAHAHPECGNGVAWSVELRRGNTRQRLASGIAQGNRRAEAGPIENLAVESGDLLSLVIGPRDGNHACDLTDIEFAIQSPKGEWDLARDVSGDILASNPRDVWHFYTEPTQPKGLIIPKSSLLAKWQALSVGAEKQRVAEQLEALLLGGPREAGSPDDLLYRDLASLSGPLFGGDFRAAGSTSGTWSLDPGMFEGEDLVVQAPSVLEIRLPADLLGGAEFVVDGVLDAERGYEGSVQLFATTSKPARVDGLVPSEARVSTTSGAWTSDNRRVSVDAPIIVNEGAAARERIEADVAEFRHWFPAALCYVKIVPVDEVVTLTLYYREDEHLARLMLNETEKATLDRLWAELRYISHDALKLVDVFEQLWQYATQDADPKVFEPMRQPIMAGAQRFRQLLIGSEPRHVDALVSFARRAYRRPLASDEERELRSLYQTLRDRELPHEEAFRATLACIFVSPAFLYRLEKAAPGRQSAPVSNNELATRLSYFLWSSMPDEELFKLAERGALADRKVLAAQARRMLKDPRARRLATEFACMWLHVHDFASLDEKSERHFPTFADLRGAMYEETILFFADLFQRDGSILEIFDADHTFLNEKLALHYGIPGVTGPEWRRVDGVKRFSRGGILGHATVLAKQSGASRTSPILRGNWVSEALLGEKLPRPPKDVPELPSDEAGEGLTVRQLVERHSSDPRCYGCHQRIDGYGFALEGFDAIGRARTQDLGGRTVSTRATLFDGTEVDGLRDLTGYLANTRRDTVVRQFSRKLLGYALGRGVLLSDKPLLEEMERELRRNDYRFSAAVETILRSRQFREIRGRDMVDDR